MVTTSKPRTLRQPGDPFKYAIAACNDAAKRFGANCMCDTDGGRTADHVAVRCKSVTGSETIQESVQDGFIVQQVLCDRYRLPEDNQQNEQQQQEAGGAGEGIEPTDNESGDSEKKGHGDDDDSASIICLHEHFLPIDGRSKYTSCDMVLDGRDCQSCVRQDDTCDAGGGGLLDGEQQWATIPTSTKKDSKNAGGATTITPKQQEKTPGFVMKCGNVDPLFDHGTFCLQAGDHAQINLMSPNQGEDENGGRVLIIVAIVVGIVLCCTLLCAMLCVRKPKRQEQQQQQQQDSLEADRTRHHTEKGAVYAAAPLSDDDNDDDDEDPKTLEEHDMDADSGERRDRRLDGSVQLSSLPLVDNQSRGSFNKSGRRSDNSKRRVPKKKKHRQPHRVAPAGSFSSSSVSFLDESFEDQGEDDDFDNSECVQVFHDEEDGSSDDDEGDDEDDELGIRTPPSYSLYPAQSLLPSGRNKSWLSHHTAAGGEESSFDSDGCDRSNSSDNDAIHSRRQERLV